MVPLHWRRIKMQLLQIRFKVNQNAVAKLVDNTFNASLSANYSGPGFNFTSQTSYQSNYRYYATPIDGDFSPADAITIINNYGSQWNNIKVATEELRFREFRRIVEQVARSEAKVRGTSPTVREGS